MIEMMEMEKKKIKEEERREEEVLTEEDIGRRIRRKLRNGRGLKRRRGSG